MFLRYNIVWHKFMTLFDDLSRCWVFCDHLIADEMWCWTNALTCHGWRFGLATGFPPMMCVEGAARARGKRANKTNILVFLLRGKLLHIIDDFSHLYCFCTICYHIWCFSANKKLLLSPYTTGCFHMHLMHLITVPRLRVADGRFGSESNVKSSPDAKTLYFQQ